MIKRAQSSLIKITKEQQPLVPQPSDQIFKRVAIVYKPAKNAMQSGNEGSREWRLKFNITEKFENPLIGWTSSTDALQALRMKFETKERAVQFCEKNGWEVRIMEPKLRMWKMKTYADNFKHSYGPLRQAKTK